MYVLSARDLFVHFSVSEEWILCPHHIPWYFSWSGASWNTLSFVSKLYGWSKWCWPNPIPYIQNISVMCGCLRSIHLYLKLVIWIETLKQSLLVQFYWTHLPFGIKDNVLASLTVAKFEQFVGSTDWAVRNSISFEECYLYRSHLLVKWNLQQTLQRCQQCSRALQQVRSYTIILVTSCRFCKTLYVSVFKQIYLVV